MDERRPARCTAPLSLFSALLLLPDRRARAPPRPLRLDLPSDLAEGRRRVPVAVSVELVRQHTHPVRFAGVPETPAPELSVEQWPHGGWGAEATGQSPVSHPGLPVIIGERPRITRRPDRVGGERGRPTQDVQSPTPPRTPSPPPAPSSLRTAARTPPPARPTTPPPSASGPSTLSRSRRTSSAGASRGVASTCTVASAGHTSQHVTRHPAPSAEALSSISHPRPQCGVREQRPAPPSDEEHVVGQPVARPAVVLERRAMTRGDGSGTGRVGDAHVSGGRGLEPQPSAR